MVDLRALDDIEPSHGRYVWALRALERAGDRGLSKSALARELFDEVTGSTQALVTRLTAQLAERGWTKESPDGRRKVVRLTREGREWLHRASDPAEFSSRKEALAGAPLEHAKDRLRFHLHVAAVHVLALGSENRDFADGLMALIGEPEDTTKTLLLDSLELRRTAGTRSLDADRFGLLELAVQFQDPAERERLASDVIRLGQRLRAGMPEALLWVGPAVSIAALLGLDPDPKKHAARDHILSLVRPHLRALRNQAPGPTLVWRGRGALALGAYEAARNDWVALAQLPGTMSDDVHDESVARHLRTCETTLIDVGRLNSRLMSCDEIERHVVLPRVLSNVKGAADHTIGVAPVDDAIQWTLANRGSIAEAWTTAIRELPEEHKVAYEALAGLRHNKLEHVTDVHRTRARWVLSTRWSGETPHKPDAEDLQRFYAGQVRNNAWSTCMMWGDLALRGKLGESHHPITSGDAP